MPENLPRSIPRELNGIDGIMHHRFYGFRNFKHANVLARTEIEDLANYATSLRVNELVERLAMICDEEEIAPRGAVAMHLERLSEKAARHKAWNDFLEMLKGTEIIERADDHCRNPISRPVGVDKAVSPAFGGGVRAHRVERMPFVHHRVGRRAVDLGCRNMDK